MTKNNQKPPIAPGSRLSDQNTRRRTHVLAFFCAVGLFLVNFFGRYLYSFGSRSLVYQIFENFYFWPLLVQFWSTELSISNF